MNYQIDYEKDPKRDDILVLSNGIAAHARKMKGHAPIKEFAFFIRDENQLILGGTNGAMYYGCLYIDQLWVDENLRGKRFGTKLIQEAEKLGRNKGCLFATVNTMNWEALDFYKKLGFTVEFERRGYVKDSIFYFLRKEFK